MRASCSKAMMSAALLMLCCITSTSYYVNAFSNQRVSLSASSVQLKASAFVHVTQISRYNGVARRNKNRLGSGSSASLSMHMGHSHSHHHHHSHSHQSNNNNNKSSYLVPRGWRGKLLLLSKRRIVRIVFAALITLLPPFLKSIKTMSFMSSPQRLNPFQAFTKSDVGAFILLSGLLAIFDSIRDEAKAVIDKGDQWRLSMLKHSTPLSSDYFFKNDNAADRVTFFGVIINLLLSSGKAAVGIACHSSALIADAGHSLSDLFSDFVTLWAVQIARLPPDDDHPYGHGKFEKCG